MTTDVGEYLVGAYLKVKLGCDFVDYNVRPPTGGIEGLGELDVVGLDLANKIAYLCEVTTHLAGLEYGKGYADSIARIRKKHERQKQFATKYLTNFPSINYMFWAPRVPKGTLSEALSEIAGLTLVINKEYTRRVDELRVEAKQTQRDVGNPVFRTLQILEHLRR